MTKMTKINFAPYVCEVCTKKEFLTKRALNLHNYAYHGISMPRDRDDDDDDNVHTHEESNWPGDR